jgi:integrase
MILGVPEFRKFRKAVDNISNVRNKTLIITLYLTAARVSEIITKTSPWERKHHQTRPSGNDLSFGLAKIRGSKKMTILLINVPLAKRQWKSKRENFRVVALPCKLEYEPWTIDLVKHILENKRLSFDLTRQRVGQIVRKELQMLDSRVNPSKLRAYRISHLAKEYSFDQMDLMAYLGLPMKTSRELTGLEITDTSNGSAWRGYFPKLLKPFFQTPK